MSAIFGLVRLGGAADAKDLEQMQRKDLDKLGELVAKLYRKDGSLESLRHNPRAMRELMSQMTSQIQPNKADYAARGGPGGPPAGRKKPWISSVACRALQKPGRAEAR